MNDTVESAPENDLAQEESPCTTSECESTSPKTGCCVESLCLNASGTVQLKAKGAAPKTNAGFPKQVHVAILPPGTSQIPTSPPKTTTVAPVDAASGAWDFSWGSSEKSFGPAECNRINYVVFWFEYRFENPMTGQVITYYSLEARSIIPGCCDLPACLPAPSVETAEPAKAEPTPPLVALEGGPVPSLKTKKRAKKR